MRIFLNIGACLLTGGMDTYRQTNDPHHPQVCGGTRAAVQRLLRQSKNVAAARVWGPARGQGVLHVPSEHEPDDQSSRVPSGGSTSQHNRRGEHAVFCCRSGASEHNSHVQGRRLSHT